MFIRNDIRKSFLTLLSFLLIQEGDKYLTFSIFYVNNIAFK